jgi:nucleotide-binding universal stress UspA family protein
VISSGDISSTQSSQSESSVHRMHLARMQQWSQGLDLHDHQVSFHVLESGDVADALVKYAQGNEVSMIIMGAATHGLQMQRFLATVPIKVAMEAPCTVILVKQDVPFEFLGTLNDE